MRCIILFSASARQSAWDVSARISRNRQYSTQRLHKQSMDEASPTHVPGASGTLAVYHSRVQHTREAPGLQTGARREADAPLQLHICEGTRSRNAELLSYLARVHVRLQGGGRLLQAVDRQAFGHPQVRFVVALMDDAMGLPRARRPFVVVHAAGGEAPALAHKAERRHRSEPGKPLGQIWAQR